MGSQVIPGHCSILAGYGPRIAEAPVCLTLKTEPVYMNDANLWLEHNVWVPAGDVSIYKLSPEIALKWRVAWL